MILLALAAVAALAAEPQAPGEPVLMWDRLRGAYADYLASVPSDPVGRRAAEFLRSSTIALEGGELQARLGEDVFAAYDASRRAIQLDRQGLKDVWLSLHSAELQPERARPLIERTAGALVHEIRHAVDHEALGEAPLFLETELAAYADQAAFLCARLAADPKHRGLRRIDEAVAGRLGEKPVVDGRWWTRPLPKKKLTSLKRAVDEARRGLPEAMTSQEANDWFLVRAWAGGLKRFRADLSEAGYLPPVSLLDPPPGAAAKSRLALEHLWRQLAVLRSTKLPPQEKDRRARGLEAELGAAERLAAFWGDAAKLKLAGAYVTRTLDERRKEWEDLHARPSGR